MRRRTGDLLEPVGAGELGPRLAQPHLARGHERVVLPLRSYGLRLRGAHVEERVVGIRRLLGDPRRRDEDDDAREPEPQQQTDEHRERREQRIVARTPEQHAAEDLQHRESCGAEEGSHPHAPPRHLRAREESEHDREGEGVDDEDDRERAELDDRRGPTRAEVPPEEVENPVEERGRHDREHGCDDQHAAEREAREEVARFQDDVAAGVLREPEDAADGGARVGDPSDRRPDETADGDDAQDAEEARRRRRDRDEVVARDDAGLTVVADEPGRRCSRG